MHVCMPSCINCVWFFATLWTIAHQVPPWDSPGKNTGVGCYALLQGIFLTQESNLVSCIAGRFFTIWATRESPYVVCPYFMSNFISLVQHETYFLSGQSPHSLPVTAHTYISALGESPSWDISSHLTCWLMVLPQGSVKVPNSLGSLPQNPQATISLLSFIFQDP